jgi:hypothetical protein
MDDKSGNTERVITYKEQAIHYRKLIDVIMDTMLIMSTRKELSQSQQEAVLGTHNGIREAIRDLL